jgi:hypothetical protein
VSRGQRRRMLFAGAERAVDGTRSKGSERPASRAQAGSLDVSQETSEVTGAGLDERAPWRVVRVSNALVRAYERSSAGRPHERGVGTTDGARPQLG